MRCFSGTFLPLETLFKRVDQISFFSLVAVDGLLLLLAVCTPLRSISGTAELKLLYLASDRPLVILFFVQS